MKRIYYSFALIAVFTLQSCERHEKQAHEEHAHEAISFTLFEKNYELFMEFDPLVAGDTSNFIIHLTRLSDYKPLTNKAIVLEISGPEHHRQVIGLPQQAGIYLANYAPRKAGHAQIKLIVGNPDIEEKFNIQDIHIYEKKQALNAHEHKVTEARDISFLKEQAWKTDFGISEVRRMPFANLLKVSGEIRALPTANYNVIANASGILEYNRENLLPGQEVKNGEVLFHIQSGKLAGKNIRTQYVKVKSEHEQAKSDYERAKSLVEDQIISKREFDAVKSQFEKARAEFESIRMNYKDDGQIIASPAEGVISSIHKENGSYVSQGDLLVNILKTQKLILKADVPQNAIDKLAFLRSANFKTSAGNKLYHTDSLGGHLMAVSKANITENYYLPVYFKINNPGELIPGTYAEIYLKFTNGEDALLIPESAIMENEGNHYVYVQLNGESYRRQDIDIAGSDGNMVEVTSGLKPGDWVVSKGAYRIKLASMAGELPSHGHAH
ncbi:MAG: efflux RND transporter periplasmic adaptor subunit [Bacteroidales bacterium]|nr:efflux RND transporter periplasmic adaptor subunit [Bacteroidales bacterium]MCF8387565.1 efflux RND transporter periplasmic adaptor subunit [Bacteroidales bacterium]MCF8399153.1 efflux RND transporter periplasmic adaptor subunit [Bacteroidales bacterium]